MTEQKMQLPQLNENETEAQLRKTMLNFITQRFQQYLSQNSDDVRGMLYLIAALTVLNSNDTSGQSLSTARRLAQMSVRK